MHFKYFVHLRVRMHFKYLSLSFVIIWKFSILFFTLMAKYFTFVSGVYACRDIWGSEDSLWESVLSFHHMASENWTQAYRLHSKYLYPVSHLTGHPEEIVVLYVFTSPFTFPTSLFLWFVSPFLHFSVHFLQCLCWEPHIQTSWVSY